MNENQDQDGDLKLRPMVSAMAQGMEYQLRKHDAERGPAGWLGAGPEWLMGRLQVEVDELCAAVREGRSTGEIAAEAADVANFAGMILDTLKFRDGLRCEILDSLKRIVGAAIGDYRSVPEQEKGALTEAAKRISREMCLAASEVIPAVLRDREEGKNADEE